MSMCNEITDLELKLNGDVALQRECPRDGGVDGTHAEVHDGRYGNLGEDRVCMDGDGDTVSRLEHVRSVLTCMLTSHVTVRKS